MALLATKRMCREWTFEEFGQYICRRFQIVEHFISNLEQRTQVVVVTAIS